MPDDILIEVTAGPYRGQRLTVPQVEADRAISEEWAFDPLQERPPPPPDQSEAQRNQIYINAVAGAARLRGGEAGLTLNYVAPDSAPLGSVTVDLGGAGFSESSVAMFNGGGVPTVFISSIMLRATLSAGVAGAYDVLVRDREHDSAAVSFTFS